MGSHPSHVLWDHLSTCPQLCPSHPHVWLPLQLPGFLSLEVSLWEHHAQHKARVCVPALQDCTAVPSPYHPSQQEPKATSLLPTALRLPALSQPPQQPGVHGSQRFHPEMAQPSISFHHCATGAQDPSSRKPCPFSLLNWPWPPQPPHSFFFWQHCWVPRSQEGRDLEQEPCDLPSRCMGT